MKRSSVEPLIENVGETGCLEPAFKQNINDDDQIYLKSADKDLPSPIGGSWPYKSHKVCGGQKQVAFSSATPVTYSNVRPKQTLSVDDNKPYERMELDGLFAEVNLQRREAAANRRMNDALAAEVENLKNTRAA